jgi:hypothetical protein
MIKVSFDFDGTLEYKPVQSYAKELIDRGIEVWVVTSRFGDELLYQKFFNTTTGIKITNNDLHKIANDLGIPNERIHFTNMEDKWVWLKDKEFLWHLDDDWIENKGILKNTKTKAIAVDSSSWRTKCERIIKAQQKKLL